MDLIHENFCFRRLTVTGRVSRLSKDIVLGFSGYLSFWVTVEQAPHPTKVLRVSGEIWGPQLAMAEQIKDGSVVTLIGCLKAPDLGAMIQLPGFDLEQVLEVAA